MKRTSLEELKIEFQEKNFTQEEIVELALMGFVAAKSCKKNMEAKA